jgi:hypothetical protein
MKTTATTLLLFLFLAVTASAQTIAPSNRKAFKQVQVGGGGGAFTLVLSTNLPATDTATIDSTGLDLIVGVTSFYSGTPTASENQGNTVVNLTNLVAAQASVRMFYCIPTTKASGHTFTVSGYNGGAGFNNIVLLGYAKSSPVFDGESGAINGTINPTSQPGNVTPTGSDNLFVAAQGLSQYGNFLTTTISPTFTILSRTTNATPSALIVATKMSGSSENPTFTTAGLDGGGCALVSFK